MKKVIIALLVLTACGTSVFAGEMQKEGSVLLGYAMPSGDVGDVVDGGVAFGLDYDGYKINDMWSVGGTFLYTSGSGDTTILGSSYDYDVKTWGLTPYAKYSKEVDLGGKKWNMYGLAGVGYYSASLKVDYPAPFTAFSTDESDTKFGFNFGGGAMYPLNDKMQLGLDLRYHAIYSDLSYFIPSVKFSYMF